MRKNMDICDIMTDFLNRGYDAFVNAAKNSMPTAIEILGAFSDTDEECLNLFINIIGSMISVDGTIQEKEKDLYCDLLGAYMPYDDFFNMMKSINNSDLRTLVNDFIDMVGDKVSDEAKFYFLLIILVFTCADEKLTGDENSHFVHLFD